VSRPIKYVKRSGGQALVEFALALPIFVLLFFAIVEFTHLFYVKLTLRQALRQAGRYMVTGQGQVDPNDPTNTDARIEAIKTRFRKYLIGTGLGGPTCGLTLNPASGGVPGETVVLTATCNKPTFTVLFAQFFPGRPNCLAGNVCFTLRTTWVNYQFVTA